MENPIVESDMGVTLIGGAPVSGRLLDMALARAPTLVAADSGADRALRLGHWPQAVIGDGDSLSDAAKVQLGPKFHHIAEQETTDFDKALRHIRAPFILGTGFSGARLDHGLAVLNSLARRPTPRCLLLSAQDITFLAPPDLTLRLPVGSRLSLFPMAPVTGRSTGLRWPIDGLRFAPDGMTGTSNIVSAPSVTLAFDAPGMLVILPRRRLDAVLAALGLPRPAHGG